MLMKCDYIDVLKKPGILPETVMGRACFLTGVFLLESVPTVMDWCSFEQDRREQFSYDVHRERYPVYVLWELCYRGVMLSRCGDCTDVSGDFLSVWEGPKRFLDWWKLGNFNF